MGFQGRKTFSLALFSALALAVFSTNFAGAADQPYSLQDCLDSCEKNYGYNGIFSTAQSLDSKTVAQCQSFGATGYSEYAACQKLAFDELSFCNKNCEFYRTDPCFGQCEKDYFECAKQCNTQNKFTAAVCTETFIQQCYGACNENCNKEGEKKDLACVNHACQKVAKTSDDAQKAGAVLSCSGKREGDPCGSKIACNGNTCQMTDYASAQQESLCGGKELGSKCCEPADSGDCRKTKRHVKDIQVEVKSDWWAGTCHWAAYYWWYCVPYDEQKCQYDYSKEREQKFILSEGGGKGLLDAIFCGFGVQDHFKRERDEQESVGSGGVKG